jgi:hypothetical protein
MLSIILSNGVLSGIEDAYKTAVPVILAHDPEFMSRAFVTGENREYYTAFMDGSLEGARKLADALVAKDIPYQVVCIAAKPDKLWDALDEWALTIGE